MSDDPGSIARTVRSRLGRWRRSLLGIREGQNTGWYWAAIREQQPKFTDAVRADTRVTAGRRGERHEFRNSADVAIQAIRLAIVTDAFLGQICYRAKAACQRRRIPFIPRVFHHLAVTHGGICIGDPVVMQPGVHIPHGHIVVNGGVAIGRGVVLSPFTTLGRVSAAFGGPTIGKMASIGTGAKVLGPVTVGESAKVGANSVVLADVPPHTTAVGSPARIVSGQVDT